MAMLILYCTFRKGRIIMFTRYCLEKGNRYYMGGTNDKRRRQGSGNRHADGRVDDIEYFSYRLDDGPDEENIEEIEKKEKKRKIRGRVPKDLIFRRRSLRLNFQKSYGHKRQRILRGKNYRNSMDRSSMSRREIIRKNLLKRIPSTGRRAEDLLRCS